MCYNGHNLKDEDELDATKIAKNLKSWFIKTELDYSSCVSVIFLLVDSGQVTFLFAHTGKK
jgi:hypothetical protein